MDAGLEPLGTCIAGGLDPLAPPSCPPLVPVAPAELRAFVLSGENDSDACERVLASVARAQGAIDLAVGDGLAALMVGDRLISLGFSGLRDYAREILDVEERTAQSMARLSRELRSLRCCERP